MSEVQATEQNALVQASQYFATNPKEMATTLGQLDKLSASVNISPQYMEFEKEGQKLRGVFMGFINMDLTDTETGEVKQLECIGVMDAEQNVWVNGGTQLVGTFRASQLAQYSPVEIEYRGQKKVGNNNYMKQYGVRPLVKSQ